MPVFFQLECYLICCRCECQPHFTGALCKECETGWLGEKCNISIQCTNHKMLNETSRHYTQPYGNGECDRIGDSDKSPQWSGDGWYRFTGAAGTKMATKKEVTKKYICGTAAAGHLDTDEHPDLAEGQSQDQKVCFHGSEGQCHRSTTVKIQECKGFYIYKLPNTPSCNWRYCGAGNNS